MRGGGAVAACARLCATRIKLSSSRCTTARATRLGPYRRLMPVCLSRNMQTSRPATAPLNQPCCGCTSKGLHTMHKRVYGIDSYHCCLHTHNTHKRTTHCHNQRQASPAVRWHSVHTGTPHTHTLSSNHPWMRPHSQPGPHLAKKSISTAFSAAVLPAACNNNSTSGGRGCNKHQPTTSRPAHAAPPTPKMQQHLPYTQQGTYDTKPARTEAQACPHMQRLPLVLYHPG